LPLLQCAAAVNNQPNTSSRLATEVSRSKSSCISATMSSCRDVQQGNALVLDREIELPAGRVQPGAYGQFQEFARQADEALFHSVRVRLP
jgi:hypothetical protein